MKIAVSSESTIDLTKELLKEFNIQTVPFSVILGADAKLDGEFPVQEIYDYVAKTKQLPKTSAVNQFQYEEHFNNLLKEYDEVIHIAFSSELSSAYRNAMLAAEECNGKVHIIDSRSLSTGIALLAMYAADLVKEGLEINEIVNKVSERVKSVQASFVLSNVDYLYKGGRCSKIAFLGANIFHICPQIVVADGKMDAGKKYRGKFDFVAKQYVDETLQQFDHPDLTRVFLTYSSKQDESLIGAIKDKLIAKGFKTIYETTAGGTIASHCGPNCLGVLYINDR